MSAPRPIEIIGGGLAGLSLGLALRRRGVPAEVMDAGDYPRHRVCGEFIAGLGPATRERLGLDEFLADALHHREVAWFGGNKVDRVHSLPEPALGISRHRLDARLARAFVAAGGTLRTRTRALDLGSAPGRVLATGRRAGRSPWLGLKVHAHEMPLERDLELHLGDRAYVGLCRVEDDRVNVCGLFRRRRLARRGARLLLDYLRATGLGGLAERIAAAGVHDDSFCAVAALDFTRRVESRAGIRIGDACAVIPPFTGNGMAMAFQSAECALGPLRAYAIGEKTWAEASRDVNAALRARFRVRLASAGVLHPFLLERRRQRWIAALGRTGLLPFRGLYAALH